jgi:hypothetical protein
MRIEVISTAIKQKKPDILVRAVQIVHSGAEFQTKERFFGRRKTIMHYAWIRSGETGR